ncbi:MAG: PilC/PilY family type IV pilus protein [Pseudomonadota bacterium]
MKHYYFVVRLVVAVVAGMSWPATAVHAATSDLANAPLASLPPAAIKPNVLFIMDNSGSMATTYVPDLASNFRWISGAAKPKYGMYNYVCNPLAYNPAITYSAPPKADGTGNMDNASFSAARVNGYVSTSATVDLRSAFNVDGVAGNDRAAFYYRYSGAADERMIWSPAFPLYARCVSVEGVNPGLGFFTKVTVDSNSGVGTNRDERTNFANWFSYYRTRMLTMKAGVSRAFKEVSGNIRVGYFTILTTFAAGAPNMTFQNIADFSGTHKTAFFNNLYLAEPSYTTPLRPALTRAGLIYAGRYLTGENDPVQYSCQRNFTILSTDGNWNSAEEKPGIYSPGKLDGTPVGNQDNLLTRPMYDGTSTATPPTAGGASDTLADIAAYYYNTDLRTPELGNCAPRTGIDLCENNVPGSSSDNNPKQHMTTFTIGLGVDGTLRYDENYDTATSGDFFDIKQGTKNWPDASPAAAEFDGRRIDDLWHAAVNGHGKYFSAKTPQVLYDGMSKALESIALAERTGSSAAAATSNLEPVLGDNYVYMALYRSLKWDGDLQARSIDPATGALSTNPIWTAQTQLDAKVSADSDTRTIYTYDQTLSTKLKTFVWDNLSNSEKALFENMCGSPNKLSQCVGLTNTQKTMMEGQNLLNFIRGQYLLEERTANVNPLYRMREHVLGDMVNSQPVYVKRPPFKYSDANYSTFRDTTQLNRAGRVYVAANDGMLHAFNADTGAEEWAYVPSEMMPSLYRLADKNYEGNHRYYVDGTPVIGDICPRAPADTCSASQWKTILVGGFNAGGRGYYALDITDPANPKALWNYKTKDLGYTFGNPVITKRANGAWVVVFASGYNNLKDTADDESVYDNDETGRGDGQGHLYVLDAYTGVKQVRLDTGIGTRTTPSGLAKINAWIESTSDNTAKRFYGGDLLGNVWRFDIDDVVAPSGREAFKIAELGNSGSVGIQPITIKPELTEIQSGGQSYAVVHVATGRYMGATDLLDASKTQQSIYAIKDTLANTSLGKVRASAADLVQQTLTAVTGGAGRSTSTNPVNWATNNGWYVDLNPGNTSPGERVTVEMQQQLGLLTVVANVPESNSCTVGGYAWLYHFDIRSGQYVQSAVGSLAGKKLSQNALAAGLKTVLLTTGKTTTYVTDTGGGITGMDDPSSGGGAGTGARRISWRELTE